MNFINRLGEFLNRLFRSSYGEEQEDMVFGAKEMIAKQKRSRQKLNESLVDLIFQRKKFESQHKSLESKRQQMKLDVETAAFEDRDGLALRLMQELDLVSKEFEEAQNNLSAIVSEIETAKNVDVELQGQIERAESQMAILISRSRSVKMREDLRSQFSKIQNDLSFVKPGQSVVEESILKLESRLENLKDSGEDWKKEVAKMRKERTDHIRVARLQQLKMKLKSKQLPGKIRIPEVVYHSR